MTTENKRSNLKQLFCFHNYQFVKETLLIETALIHCKKCKKEKRISFHAARNKGFITSKEYSDIMSDFH